MDRDWIKTLNSTIKSRNASVFGRWMFYFGAVRLCFSRSVTAHKIPGTAVFCSVFSMLPRFYVDSMLRFCLRDCRNDYIAEIQVVYGHSDELPTGQGWELVQKSVSGKSANLNQVRISCEFFSAVRNILRHLFILIVRTSTCGGCREVGSSAW